MPQRRRRAGHQRQPVSTDQVALDGAGNLYIADTNNNLHSQGDTDQVHSHVAGTCS